MMNIAKIKSKFNIQNLRRAYGYFKKNGFREAFYTTWERAGSNNQEAYSFIELTGEEEESQKATPLVARKISILVPAYETKEIFLKEMITSVIEQTYPHWELIIADASKTDCVKCVVEQYKDERICYLSLNKNEGISENTNAALELATGEFTGLLDHDDTLTKNALFEMAQALQESNGVAMVYSDEDKMNGDGSRFFEPHFKREFDLDLLLSNNYICHFLVMKTSIMKEIKFRKTMDGAQDFDLTLRAADLILNNKEQIVHVPKVLYHWRCHEASTAANPASKMYAYEAGKHVVEDYIEKKGWSALVSHSSHLGFYNLTYESDVFDIREEIGAVGGPVYYKGKIAGGAMNQDGIILYGGLRRHFSGYMNRAVLKQQVGALDLRNILVRPELEFIHTECKMLMENKISVQEASIIFSKRVRELGYVLLYDPALGGTRI